MCIVMQLISKLENLQDCWDIKFGKTIDYLNCSRCVMVSCIHQYIRLVLNTRKQIYG